MVGHAGAFFAFFTYHRESAAMLPGMTACPVQEVSNENDKRRN